MEYVPFAEFVAEFQDMTWAPLTPEPKLKDTIWRAMQGRGLTGAEQMRLGSVANSFLSAIIEEARQLGKLLGSYRGLSYAQISSAMLGTLRPEYGAAPWPGAPPPIVKSMPVDAVKASIKIPRATKAQVAVLIKFISRCIEAWWRNGWNLPSYSGPPEYRETYEELKGDIRKFIEGTKRGLLPSPKLP